MPIETQYHKYAKQKIAEQQQKYAKNRHMQASMLVHILHICTPFFVIQCRQASCIWFMCRHRGKCTVKETESTSTWLSKSKHIKFNVKDFLKPLIWKCSSVLSYNISHRGIHDPRYNSWWQQDIEPYSIHLYTFDLIQIAPRADESLQEHH